MRTPSLIFLASFKSAASQAMGGVRRRWRQVGSLSVRIRPLASMRATSTAAYSANTAETAAFFRRKLSGLEELMSASKCRFAIMTTCLFAGTAAFALSPSAPSNYGSVIVSRGFGSVVVSVFAGGTTNAQADLPGNNCPGYVSDAPDYKLTYESATGPFSVTVEATADTTLIINDPNGNWFCDDDSGGGTTPLITFVSPLQGRYDIWVGTYSPGGIQPATLRILDLPR